MIIGYDMLHYDKSSTFFSTRIEQGEPTSVEMYKGLIDEVYMDSNINLPYVKSSPLSFLVSTIFNAKLNKSLEGGNFQLDGQLIEQIGVQKRKVGTSDWINVAIINYQSDKIDYSILDKYVELDQEYEYAIFPVSNLPQGVIQGLKNVGDSIRTKFEGVFLSDKDNNYHFFMNVEYGDISHNLQTKIHEPICAKYPITTYGASDYSTFTMSAWYMSKDSVNNGIVISQEKNRRDNLLEWLKNKKPKVYRDGNGELKMVAIVDNPTISPVENLNGAYSVNFKMVEIGDMSDNEMLSEYNLIIND